MGNNISGNGGDYGEGGERRGDRKMIIVTARIKSLVVMVALVRGRKMKTRNEKGRSRYVDGKKEENAERDKIMR